MPRQCLFHTLYKRNQLPFDKCLLEKPVERIKNTNLIT
jgi:hypothetical protein